MTGTVHWRHALLHAVMKIEVAVAELKGVRVAIAFAPPSWVAPGVGDALLARLRPYFPTLPILLADSADAVQAIAADGLLAAQQRFHAPD